MVREPVTRVSDLMVILGAGGHGRVVADILSRQFPSVDIAFLDDNVMGPHVSGRQVLGSIDRLPTIVAAKGRANVGVVVGIGDNHVRRAIAERLMRLLASREVELVTAVDPSAVLSPSAVLGSGTVAMPNVVVNSGTSVGDHCILNTSCSVDHDCQLGDYVHICPGAHLAGTVSVGEGALVGTGSSIIPGVRVGKGTVIGAGSVVLRDIPNDVVAYGVPCKVVRRLK